jgi:hypothetical protein
MVGAEVLKSVGIVLLGAAHQLTSWLENASSENEVHKEIERTVFGKGGPGRRLRHSAKEREELIADQEEALTTLGRRNVDERPVDRPVGEWPNAPHRWETDETKYVSLVLSYLRFASGISDASPDVKLKPEIREANVAASEALIGLEPEATVGLHADFMAAAHETLEQVQADFHDASGIPQTI